MPGPDNMKTQLQQSTTLGDDRYYFRRMRDILQNSNQPNGTDGSFMPSVAAGPPLYPVQLMDHIYIGNQRNADNVELLRRLGITHVLNCAGLRRYDFTRSPYPKEAGIKGFLMISAEDHEDFDIKRHFEDAIAFLDGVKRCRGRALVHCNLGVNRSGAVVAAYLLIAERRPLLDVISYLKSKRSVILSNKGFRRQLIRFARERGLLDPVISNNEDGPLKSDTVIDGLCSNGERTNSRVKPNVAEQCRPTPVLIVVGNHIDSTEHTSRIPWSAGSSAQQTPSYGDPDRSPSKQSTTNNWLLTPVYEKPSASVDDVTTSSMFGGFLTLLGSRRKPMRSTSYSNVSVGSPPLQTPLSAAAAASGGRIPSDSLTTGSNPLSSTVRPLRVYTRSSTDSELYRPPSLRGRPASAAAGHVNHQRFSENHLRQPP